jgi:hypothetical protein
MWCCTPVCAQIVWYASFWPELCIQMENCVVRALAFALQTVKKNNTKYSVSRGITLNAT